MHGKGETIWWAVFAQGGVVAGMLAPILIVITGILVPAGLVTAKGLLELFHNPLTRIVLFVFISLSLFHAAHRLIFTLADLGLKHIRGILAVLLYGLAFIGTAAAVPILIRL